MRLPTLLLLALLGCDTALPVHDCDGAEPTDWYRDDDGDGFGAADHVRPACEAPDGFVATAGDCDDTDPAAYPEAPERCGGGDDDCDGVEDDDPVDPTPWYPDADGDGYGDPTTPAEACAAPAGHGADATDCDDADADVHPGAHERCDEADRDCDGDPVAGAIDATAWYPDADGDGYGEEGAAVGSCDEPQGDVATGGDCDDADPLVHPGADEWCDLVDQDCDGDPEAGALDMATWYADGDADGYGTTRVTEVACGAPEGFVAEGTDCNDRAAGIYPGAPDFCDAVDHDCDGETAEADSVDALTGYTDADADGYGDAALPQLACELPAGTSADGTDCDDTDPRVHPGAEEACGGVDHDCDGATDEADSVDASAWYTDADGDGYGDPDGALGAACDAPSADAVADACDCDDADDTTNPDGADCEVVTCAGGAEVWLDDACGLREVTTEATGTAGAPAVLVVDGDGTVSFCPGTHHVRVVGTAGATVRVVGVEGAATTTLASGDGPNLAFDGALSVEGLTLDAGTSAYAGGAAIDGTGALTLTACVVSGAASAAEGGSIVAASGDVTLDGVEVTGNAVHFSGDAAACTGAVVTVGGDLAMTDSVVTGNRVTCAATSATTGDASAAGGAVLVGGAATLDGSEISDNTLTVQAAWSAATAAGAAGLTAAAVSLLDSVVARNTTELALDCAAATCARTAGGGGVRAGQVTLVDSRVADNEVATSGTVGAGVDTRTLQGGGLYVDGGSFSCESSDLGDHGVVGNLADAGGGLWWASPASGATLASDGCDWTGATDNAPDDVAGAASWSGDDDADLVCDEAGVCVE